jgi:hypothetical protein
MRLTRRRRRLLGQIMVEKGLITPRQLEQALRTQRGIDEKLGRIMVELGYVSELDMFRTLSDQDGLPFPSRFLRVFHRAPGQPAPRDAFARHRTRVSP